MARQFNWELHNLRERCRIKGTESFWTNAESMRSDFGSARSDSQKRSQGSRKAPTASTNTRDQDVAANENNPQKPRFVVPSRDLARYAKSCGAREAAAKRWKRCPPALYRSVMNDRTRLEAAVREHPEFKNARKKRLQAKEIEFFLRRCGRADFLGKGRPTLSNKIKRSLDAVALERIFSNMKYSSHYQKGYKLARCHFEKVSKAA